MPMGSAISGIYDLRLVTLSILIAILASYAALDLAGRITADTRTSSRTVSFAWLGCGSVAMGTGIWAMHYVGMAAYRLPIPVAYDWPTVVLSLLAAIFASAVALYYVSQPTLSPTGTAVGSLFMGGGIAAMHYIGMQAMRLNAMCQYSVPRVALSIVLAVVISYLAIFLVFTLRDSTAATGWRKLGGAILLGVAIPVTHYAGMAAVIFIAMPVTEGSIAHAIPVSDLGLTTIAIATILLLGVVVYTAATDRRFRLQAELLAESRTQVYSIFENLQEGILVLDCKRNIIEINQTAMRLLCIAGPSEAYGRVPTGIEFYLRNGAPLPREQWPSERALRGEFLRNFEVEIRNKANSSATIVEVCTAPMPSLSGRTEQIIISYRDVTRPVQINEARMRLAAIVESSDDAIISKDMRGIITSWNAGAEKIFGYTADEIIGQPFTRLVPIDRLPEEEDLLARIQRGETIDSIETLRKKKNGQVIHVALSISPIRDTTGRIVGASKIARNITDRKLLESRLYESQKMEAIGQLTGGIAHDFNNLLGIVIGNLDLLERMVTTNPPALKRIRTAQMAANRGADLTRRLLAFASREQLRPALVSIEEPIRNTLELAARALGSDIVVTTNFDPQVPALLVDCAGLENALLNLFVNARDAMPYGGTLRITTQLASPGHPSSAMDAVHHDYVCVSVTDSGQGMSQETIDRAFEPFFTTKERGKGTGLGLAMVYGFFKQSGGTVRIDSVLGRGTTVSFFLPLTPNDSHRPPALPSQHVEFNSPAAYVLLVDDELDLLEIATAYLIEAGFTVLQARNGSQALDVLTRHPEIQIIVTDVIMPGGINGVELVEQALSLRPALRFVYCSGFPAGALEERHLLLDEGQLLRKPYQRSELVAAIRDALANPGKALQVISSA